VSRQPRDREAERAAITAAADRLLAGTPLHSPSGKLTGSELIVESGLRRDVVYGDHRDLVDQFRARAKAQTSVPRTLRELTDKRDDLASKLAQAKNDLAGQRAENAVLRRVIAELSLELQQAHQQLATPSGVTRLPTRRAVST
jgi:hypothetical protein